jgi:integrase/recombinase XerC
MDHMPLERRPQAQLARLQPFVSSFLGGLKPSTMAGYRKDLGYFATFVGADGLDQAAAILMGDGRGAANALARNWQASMRKAGLSPATINRRICALKAMVNVAEEQGLVEWTLKIKGLRKRAYRDVRGPGLEAVQNMLNLVARRRPRVRERDVAIVRVLFDLGLRSGELVSLDLVHADLAGGRLWILGKGHEEREWRSLSAETAKALSAWVDLRGRDRGALFTTHAKTPADGGRRVRAQALYQMIRRLGAKVGVRARPHGLRHTAVTEALVVMDGDVAKVRQYSRHKSVETVMAYNDARVDTAGKVGAKVAARLVTPDQALDRSDPAS